PGIDTASTAIEKARAKARQRASSACFLVWDALEVGKLGRIFDTIIDCGLFHLFSRDERTRFAHSLAAGLRSGGRYYLLCVSEQERGPRPCRVTRGDIES